MYPEASLGFDNQVNASTVCCARGRPRSLLIVKHGIVVKPYWLANTVQGALGRGRSCHVVSHRILYHNIHAALHHAVASRHRIILPWRSGDMVRKSKTLDRYVQGRSHRSSSELAVVQSLVCVAVTALVTCRSSWRCWRLRWAANLGTPKPPSSRRWYRKSVGIN